MYKTGWQMQPLVCYLKIWTELPLLQSSKHLVKPLLKSNMLSKNRQGKIKTPVKLQWNVMSKTEMTFKMQRY